MKLEGHSVERMYLPRRCFDGSMNKTVLKPCIAAAAGRQYVYVGFSQRKILRSGYTIFEIYIVRPHYNPGPGTGSKVISLSSSMS